MNCGRSVVLVGVMASFGCQVDAMSSTDATVAEPIVDGVASPDDNAVVSITSPTQFCSGTLIAANLVLTARHCVIPRVVSTADCANHGAAPNQDAIISDYDASQLQIRIGASYLPDPAAHGKAIIAPDSDSVCWDDIALVLLDRKLESVPILPVRLTRPTKVGELMAIVGFGQLTSVGVSSSERRRRNDLPVIDIGPNRFNPDGGMAPSGKFWLGTGICNGDTGGPAIVEASGAVAGVASMVQGADCVDSTRSEYELLAEHVDLVSRGFDAADALPWLENETAPIQTTQPTNHGCSISTSRGMASGIGATLAGWPALGVVCVCLLARRRHQKVTLSVH